MERPTGAEPKTKGTTLVVPFVLEGTVKIDILSTTDKTAAQRRTQIGAQRSARKGHAASVKLHRLAAMSPTAARRGIFIGYHVILFRETAANNRFARTEYLIYAALFFLQASPTT